MLGGGGGQGFGEEEEETEDQDLEEKLEQAYGALLVRPARTPKIKRFSNLRTEVFLDKEIPFAYSRENQT